MAKISRSVFTYQFVFGCNENLYKASFWRLHDCITAAVPATPDPFLIIHNAIIKVSISNPLEFPAGTSCFLPLEAWI